MTLNSKLVVFGYIFLLGLLLLTWVISINYNTPIYHFTGDPSKVFNTHPFIGMISNIGVLLWCSTSAICLFSFFLLEGDWRQNNKLFILVSGLVSMYLLLDDLFMMHEVVLPQIPNISQTKVFALYLLIGFGYLYFFRKQIMENYFRIFLLAWFFLGSSVAIDLFLPSQGLEHLIEDGLKLLGIFTWLVYFSKVCYSNIKISTPKIGA